MSPASSGALEVERYIGACLITSQNQGRHKKNFVDHQRYAGCNAVDAWHGGVPLISYHQRWRRPADNHHQNPLSRLAVHTQGAPLILSNRYSNKKKHTSRNLNTGGGASNHNNNNTNGNNKIFDGVKQDLNTSAGVAADSVSVTSDESSGSNNSETCLPRIIKPRKRRKKDRKPSHLLRPVSQDGSFSTDSASPDVDSPQIISFVPYFTYLSRKTADTEFFADPTPDLYHSFEDLEDFDVNGNQTESSCQCKYCDPAGQIWDIDRSCYSPYLTSPEKSFFAESEKSNMLTKSYSSSLLDCLSSLTLEDCKASASSPRASRDLEVSTKIVTSLNGHRDLEIRFFSHSRTKDVPCFEKDVNLVNSVNKFVSDNNELTTVAAGD